MYSLFESSWFTPHIPNIYYPYGISALDISVNELNGADNTINSAMQIPPEALPSIVRGRCIHHVQTAPPPHQYG